MSDALGLGIEGISLAAKKAAPRHTGAGAGTAAAAGAGGARAHETGAGAGAGAGAAAKAGAGEAAGAGARAKKADRAGANEAFLARVKLNEMDSWCYHEGSYGHNPEFGSTHTLSSAAAAHTKTDYDDKGGNVRRSEANGATTFWRIHTTGEAQVPKDVSPTEAIGHSHEVSLEGDKLTVVVHYHRAGESKTTELSVAALWNEYQGNGKKKVEFKL